MGNQYNAMSDGIEKSNHRSNGKLFSGYSPEKQELITPDKSLIDISGKKVQSEEKTRMDIDREISELKIANMKACEIPAEAYNYKLTGNQVLVKLFKHIPYSTDSSIMMYNPLVQYYQSEGGKPAVKEAKLQFIRRGLIYNIAPGTSIGFKELFKVGNVIDLKLGINLEQKMCYLEPNDLYFGSFTEFAGLFIVNENDIEKGVVDWTNPYV